MKTILIVVTVIAVLAAWNAAPRIRHTAPPAVASPDFSRAITDHRLIVGMSEDQARASWGDPQRIDRNASDAGQLDYWHYNSANYIAFLDGRLSEIHSSSEGNIGEALRERDSKASAAGSATPPWNTSLDRNAYKR